MKMKRELPLPVVLAIAVAMGLTPWLLGEPTRPPPLTTFEQNVAMRCEVYFGPRPFTYYVFGKGELEQLRVDPVYLARVKGAYVGTIVVFKQLMAGSNQPSGVIPIDGHWEWKDPVYMAGIIAFLRGEGFKVVAYMSPHTWEAAGLPAVSIVDEVAHLGVDGGYFDGWRFGDGPEAGEDVLMRMQNRGYVTWIHGSSVPWVDKPRSRSYLMPGGELLTHYLYGEIQLLPNGNWIRWLKSRVGLVDRAPGTITYYTPCEWCPGAPRIHRSLLAKYLVATCASRKHLAAIEEEFIPEYRRLAVEYHQNPDAFARRVAEGW